MNWRNERKYLVNFSDLNNVYRWLQTTAFAKQYSDRIINNCYFDTKAFSCYFASHDGQSERRKYRLRWYGDLDNWRGSVLEHKIKSNDVNRKKYFNIEFDEAQKFGDLFNHHFFIENNLAPVILTRYSREYFGINGTGTRLTIDNNLQYFYPNESLEDSVPSAVFPKTIIEIKSETMNDISYLDFIYPITKMGKYVDGVKRLYYC